jgi:antirestriction protein ArdC
MNKVYTIVLNKIIKKLESGVVPWHCTWLNGIPKNYVSKRPYSGLNLILLGMLEYRFPYFITRNQVKELNATVNTDQNPHLVVFFKPFEREVEVINPKTGEISKELKTRYVLRYYNVYNIQQTNLKLPEIKEYNEIDNCEKVVHEMPKRPLIIHKYQSAYYSPEKDIVNMPLYGSFRSPELYYVTLFHELIHSTGHKKRLGRCNLKKGHSFGDKVYSHEELIAELGAAFLSAHTGISNQTLEDSSSYISGWLNILKENPRFIFHCSTNAKKATEYILNGDQPSGWSSFIHKEII